MKIILFMGLLLFPLKAFSAFIEIVGFSNVNDIHLVAYNDYFSKHVVDIPIHTNSIEDIGRFSFFAIEPTVYILSIDGLEWTFVLQNSDSIYVNNANNEWKYRFKQRSLNEMLKEAEGNLLELHRSFGKRKSKREFMALEKLRHSYSEKQDYLSVYINFYILGLELYMGNGYYRFVSLDTVANELQRGFYAYSVMPYVQTFRAFTMKYAWSQFHKRKIGNWMNGDSTDLIKLLHFKPFENENTNKIYQLYAVELFKSFSLEWNANYLRLSLDSIVTALKENKAIAPYNSAFNTYTNYYGVKHKRAYNMPLLSIDSLATNLSDLAKGFVLLDFWATWCGPCIRGFAALEQFQKNHPEVKVICVSRDDEFNRFSDFVKNNHYNLQFYFSGNSKLVEAAYLIQSLPHKTLIGKDMLIYINRVEDLLEIEQYVK